MEPFQLPADFLLGSATAATQIEGGDRNNSWYDWYRKGHIRDGASPERACDHWNRFRDDVALLAGMHHKIYRMGLEWSRIEPEKDVFDDQAMAHYREELLLLRQNCIRPLVTLHHFSNPLWLEREGGFESPEIVSRFVRYVRYVVSHIGDIASEYITINEPNVYITNGYIFGSWPPGKKSLTHARRVCVRMAECHIAAYDVIHQTRAGLPEKTMVGVANHLRAFSPRCRWNPLDWLASSLMRYLFQDGIVRLMSTGRLGFPASLFVPRFKPGHTCDFIGVNYYSRTAVRFRGFQDGVMPGRPVNDLGWEIYPDGLRQLCEEFSREYGVPIWITENGTCDKTDSFRGEYIAEHLGKVAEAIRNGAGVERYYHWSLMDNFEWLEGESARFGLVHVDYDTQKRMVKRSGRLYAEICRTGGLTQEMIDRYESRKSPAGRAGESL